MSRRLKRLVRPCRHCGRAPTIRKQALITAAQDMEKLSVELRHAYERINQLEAQEKLARLDLTREQARLNWLLPRQHSHHTRQSIDKELADPAQPDEKVLEDIIRREMIRDSK